MLLLQKLAVSRDSCLNNSLVDRLDEQGVTERNLPAKESIITTRIPKNKNQLSNIGGIHEKKNGQQKKKSK